METARGISPLKIKKGFWISEKPRSSWKKMKRDESNRDFIKYSLY